LKLSAQLTMVMAAIVAVFCFAMAVTGFMSLGEISDATKAADARGFSWFWVFLGAIATAFGLVSWWMVRSGIEE
jgi:hypothetical protein